MVSIKASINLGLSDALKEAFPTFKLIDPSSLSKGLIDIKEGKSINPYWLAGFTEAEGCFFVVIQENKSSPEGTLRYPTGVPSGRATYQIKIGYQVSQHLIDQSLIKSLKDFFECGRSSPIPPPGGGSGMIPEGGSEPCGKAGISFRVTKFKEITEKVIPFFDNYPILGSKLKDFKDFKGITKLMASKAHLTPEGLIKIRKIKSLMNSLREFP
uniref:LAGLIDADG endonuclease n=1 Tax=Juglanconis oblonga TaxID=1940568 RepID=A0A291LIQ8_9PEZI|nr:LAGLIDADG endonuclease [Juglanconis oblonga]